MLNSIAARSSAAVTVSAIPEPRDAGVGHDEDAAAAEGSHVIRQRAGRPESEMDVGWNRQEIETVSGVEVHERAGSEERDTAEADGNATSSSSPRLTSCPAIDAGSGDPFLPHA